MLLMLMMGAPVSLAAPVDPHQLILDHAHSSLAAEEWGLALVHFREAGCTQTTCAAETTQASDGVVRASLALDRQPVEGLQLAAAIENGRDDFPISEAVVQEVVQYRAASLQDLVTRANESSAAGRPLAAVQTLGGVVPARELLHLNQDELNALLAAHATAAESIAAVDQLGVALHVLDQVAHEVRDTPLHATLLEQLETLRAAIPADSVGTAYLHDRLVWRAGGTRFADSSNSLAFNVGACTDLAALGEDLSNPQPWRIEVKFAGQCESAIRERSETGRYTYWVDTTVTETVSVQQGAGTWSSDTCYDGMGQAYACKTEDMRSVDVEQTSTRPVEQVAYYPIEMWTYALAVEGSFVAEWEQAKVQGPFKQAAKETTEQWNRSHLGQSSTFDKPGTEAAVKDKLWRALNRQADRVATDVRAKRTAHWGARAAAFDTEGMPAKALDAQIRGWMLGRDADELPLLAGRLGADQAWLERVLTGKADTAQVKPVEPYTPDLPKTVVYIDDFGALAGDLVRDRRPPGVFRYGASPVQLWTGVLRAPTQSDLWLTHLDAKVALRRRGQRYSRTATYLTGGVFSRDVFDGEPQLSLSGFSAGLSMNVSVAGELEDTEDQGVVFGMGLGYEQFEATDEGRMQVAVPLEFEAGILHAPWLASLFEFRYNLAGAGRLPSRRADTPLFLTDISVGARLAVGPIDVQASGVYWWRGPLSENLGWRVQLGLLP